MNKTILKSTTFWGGVITLLAVLFPGVWMAFGLSADYAGYATWVQGAIGFLTVVYGRLKAGGVSITGA